ncbi:FkbM family methyltransferase [Algoriphagus algorifonticola]|uniref:FkbM family methyltransferase n=1 Tax=Algoriphagus algorifonticola TaxID=2593007 RepID=UPI0016428378|nr:FkbM family methyltransferase [Algoriphagus algorifonticola]
MKLAKNLFIKAFNSLPFVVQKYLITLNLIKKRIRFSFEKTLQKLIIDKEFRLILIGANDGLSFDDLFKHLNPNKTSGILVEPSPKYYQLLKSNLSSFNNIIFLNLALYKERSMVKLFQLNEYGLVKLPEWGRGIGSFSKEHLLKFNIEDSDIEILEVQSIPFMGILETYPSYYKVDYLQIDTEGYDAEIIKMIDFNKFHVKLIKFESINLKKGDIKELEQLFKKAEYQFFKGKEDSYAVHHSIKPIFK